ncbi:hypothetical protein [Micrococcus sp.]|uniref:hypothetical protein n=1 Tax=Micrococcus sp. TaxID=1271 RepID=UPI002A915E1F|nr:hypothetical protein [Micrococcus sp.]MDY6054491.1 hypothetical protein [Micrococcus sp.]
MSPASHRLPFEHPALEDPAIRVPLRRHQVMTLAAGVASALGTAGALTLQADPVFVRRTLEARTWGVEEITGARVAEALVGPGQTAAAVLAVLALTALVVLGASRLWGPTRWVGAVAALVGLLCGAYWAVDGQAILAVGAPLVLVGCAAMVVFCAAWLLTAFSRPVRSAFDG